MMTEIKQWEYRVVVAGSFWSTPKEEDLERIMNELGEDGWEVINVYTQSGTSKVWVAAKRPLMEAVRRKRSWPE